MMEVANAADALIAAMDQADGEAGVSDRAKSDFGQVFQAEEIETSFQARIAEPMGRGTRRFGHLVREGSKPTVPARIV